MATRKNIAGNNLRGSRLKSRALMAMVLKKNRVFCSSFARTFRQLHIFSIILNYYPKFLDPSVHLLSPASTSVPSIHFCPLYTLKSIYLQPVCQRWLASVPFSLFRRKVVWTAMARLSLLPCRAVFTPTRREGQRKKSKQPYRHHFNGFQCIIRQPTLLPRFLIATFSSRKELIARKVSQVCTTDGPAAFIRLLGQKLNATKYDRR